MKHFHHRWPNRCHPPFAASGLSFTMLMRCSKLLSSVLVLLMPAPLCSAAVSVLLAAGFLITRLAAQPDASAQDPKQVFKLLLESPPALEHMLYREKLPPVTNQAVPMDRGITESTNYALYELRWQSNAMFVRMLNSTNDLHTAKLSRVAFTLWNDEFCFLDGGTNAFRYYLEHDRARRGEVPPSYDGAWFRISRYGEILNLGLSHLWPGSVRWNGDRFSAVGIADKKPMFVSGEILRVTNNIPCELSVVYSNNMGVARYRVAYEYERYSPPFYPTRVSLFFQNRGSEVEYRTYEVLSTKQALQPMPETAFSPERFLRELSMPLRYLTNGSIYMKLPSGTMFETPAAGPKLALSKSEYYRNRYFYAEVLFISVIFVALIIRELSNQNQKEPNL